MKVNMSRWLGQPFFREDWFAFILGMSTLVAAVWLDVFDVGRQ